MRFKLTFAVACAAFLACGEAVKPPVLPAAKAGDAVALGTPTVAPSAPGTLRRTDVDALVCGGFGAFLSTVIVDEHPLFVSGKFHGFRLVDLAPAWRTSGIRAGDVVTRVNGMPIERPEQALEAFRSLSVASELRVDYERDGEPHEVRYAIDDDRPAGVHGCPGAAATSAPPAVAATPAPSATPALPAVAATPAAPVTGAAKPAKPAKPAPKK